MSFYEKIIEFKNGSLNEEQFKLQWESYNNHQFSKIKQNIMNDTESKLGGSISEIESKIQSLNEKAKLAENLPELQGKYESQIVELKSQIDVIKSEKQQELINADSEYKEVLDEYKNKVNNLQGEINKGKLFKKIVNIASELKIDPERVNDFAEDLILRNTVSMEYDNEKKSFIPKTGPVEFVDENKISQKMIFADDNFDNGIKKLYESNDRLKKYYPVVEKIKTGTGLGIFNSSSGNVNNDEVDAVDFYKSVL